MDGKKQERRDRSLASPVAVERFRRLLQEKADELGRGWQAQLGPVLGMHQSVLSRVINGKQKVSWGTLAHAADVLDFDFAYFEDPTEEAKSYRDYQRTPSRVLRGSHGTSTPEGAVFEALNVLRHATEAEHLPELADALAVEVLSLAAVKTAYALLSTRDPKERRALGMQLAWQVRDLLERPESPQTTATGAKKDPS